LKATPWTSTSAGKLSKTSAQESGTSSSALYLQILVGIRNGAKTPVWESTSSQAPQPTKKTRAASQKTIQSTIFETQKEPKTALGILGVEPRTAECITRGGDVCIARVAEENKYFADTISGSARYTLSNLYCNWAPSQVLQTHVFKRLEIAAEALQEEHRKALNIMRFYQNVNSRLEDGAMSLFDDHDAFDPCADCARCKRRKYLGHRYPNYGNVEEGFYRGLYDMGGFETVSEDEDEG
jgi:hypothetical protein